MAAGSKQEEEESMDSIDRISMLTDDILGCILSHLRFKEATVTSILSRRWRYSWTFTSKLDFDGWKALRRVRIPKNWRKKWRSELDKERVNYMRWVNSVIALCNNSCIEEFKMHFNLDRTHQTCIDEWVRYALSRNVETLELILTTLGADCLRRHDDSDKRYTFPHNLVEQYELVKLRRIRMDYLNVSNEAVELLLQKCPMLEELSIHGSEHLLGDLKFMGPFSSLKRLKIRGCFNIKSIEIRDVDLVCLQYVGLKVDFVLVNLPRLVNLDIRGWITQSMEDVLVRFSSYLPQLEVFAFDKLGPLTFQDTLLFYSMVKMSNLKELRLTISSSEGDEDSLLHLTHLLRLTPCLETFLLNIKRYDPKFASTHDEKNLGKVWGSYPHLKSVKFLNYSGTKWDLELIVHFLEKGEALEDIVVCSDRRIPESEWDPSMWERYLSNKDRKTRNRVEKQLQKLAPPSRINFSIF